MYTQCPNCDTTFRINITQLKAAQGKVRCGHCEIVFNALLNLSEQAQEIPIVSERPKHHGPEYIAADISPNPQDFQPERDPARPVAPVDDAGASKSAAPDSFIDTSEEPGRVHTSQITPPTDETVDTSSDDYFESLMNRSFRNAGLDADYNKLHTKPGLDEFKGDTGKAHHDMIISGPRKNADRNRQEPLTDYSAPIFFPDRRTLPRLPEKEIMDYDALEDYPVETKKTHNWWGTVAWTFSILTLLVLLVAQYTFFMRTDLAGYPSVRPGLEKFCALVSAVAECDIPLRRDLTQIEKLNSAVISHPDVADALLVDTMLVNKADFPQPYPYLQLTLSGIDGTVIAKRRFHPNEYLATNINIKRGMSPNKAVPITLEVAAPTADFKVQSWSIDLF
jgi:predicted Zn finger-like uncharacterized protein